MIGQQNLHGSVFPLIGITYSLFSQGLEVCQLEEHSLALYIYIYPGFITVKQRNAKGQVAAINCLFLLFKQNGFLHEILGLGRVGDTRIFRSSQTK